MARRSLRARNWIATAALIGAALAPLPAAAQQAPPEARFTVTAFQVEGDNPLDPAETERILAPYVGEHVGIAGLQAAADALEQALRQRGLAFLRVTLPPQTARGTVVLRVVSFRLGALNVKGNRHFSKENIVASLPQLKAGETPNNRELARNLALAKESPAKEVDVVVRQSEQADHIDADIEVKDTPPQKLFASLTNTGSKETGDWRVSLGYQHGNLFDRDHAFTLSYTTSPDQSGDVKQYGAHYSIPWYGAGAKTSFFYTKSDVDSGTVAGFFDVSGRGEFLGVQHAQLLLPLANYRHRIVVSLEDRLFDNEVAFSGTPIGIDVRSRPLSLRYEGKWEALGRLVGFSLERAHNLGGGKFNTDLAYAASRAGARKDWTAWRGGAEANWLAGTWLVVGRLRAQFADEPLIAGEQIGIAGSALVRGFEEREVTGDSGLQANVELWSPLLFGSLRALAFYDAGAVRIENPQAPQGPEEHIASAGAGLRWAWRGYLSVGLDAARVLNGIPARPDGHSKAHFSMLVRF